MRSPVRPQIAWVLLVILMVWAGRFPVVGAVVAECTQAVLRSAIAGGGTVWFACDGTITVSAPITISTDTVLDGTGHHVSLSGGGCEVTNCTFINNWAIGGSGNPGPDGAPWLAGGGGFAFGCIDGAKLVNSLLAGNSPNGGFIDGGHNLVWPTTNGVVGPLADNGGPTPTAALPPGSPAIDAGDDLAAPLADQRGVPRIYGSASDIGAFEAQTGVSLQAPQGAAGRIQLQVQGAASQAFLLETSSNLVDWTPVQTNQIGTGGSLVLERDAGNEPQFYRAELMLPPGGYTVEATASPAEGGSASGSGAFVSGAGKTAKPIPRRRLSLLTAVLNLDLLSGAARLAGTVSDGSWTAAVVANRAWSHSKASSPTAPLSPPAGRSPKLANGSGEVLLEP